MSNFLVTYNGNIYDIQKYLKSHPGGEDILLVCKDRDITEDFDSIGHSKAAKRTLNKYLIEEKTPNVIKEKEQIIYDPYHIYKISGVIVWYIIYNNVSLEQISSFIETISKNCSPISFFQRP